MPSRGQPVTLTYTAQSTTTGLGVPADAGNHTLRWVRDGASSAPANAPAEVDATNAPGQYNLALTADECNCLFGALCGKSSTANTRIIPLAVTFEVLPAALHSGMVAASADGVAGQAGAADVLLDALTDYGGGGFRMLETVDGALRPQSFSAGGVMLVGYSAGQDPATLVLGAAVPGSFASGTAGYILDAIKTQTDKIANGVNVVGGFVKGNLTIRQGDSYTPTSGQRLKITGPAGATWPADLTGWTVTLTGKAKADVTTAGSKYFTTILTVVDPAGVQDLYPDALAATSTAGLAPQLNGWEYTIRAVRDSDATQANTLLSGVLSVAPQLTP